MIYRRRPTPLHATRASVGIAWCAALGVVVLVSDHPVVLAGALVAVACAGVAAGVGHELGRAARFAVPLALLVALINPLAVRDGLTVIARLGEVPVLGQLDVTLEATAYGGVLALRAVVIVLVGALYTAAVDPDEVLRIFRRAGFRSALTAALATRMVPVLTRDGARLADAQRCRPPGAGQPRARRVAVGRAVAAGALGRAGDAGATLRAGAPGRRGGGRARGGGGSARPGRRRRRTPRGARLRPCAARRGSAPAVVAPRPRVRRQRRRADRAGRRRCADRRDRVRRLPGAGAR